MRTQVGAISEAGALSLLFDVRAVRAAFGEHGRKASDALERLEADAAARIDPVDLALLDGAMREATRAALHRSRLLLLWNEASAGSAVAGAAVPTRATVTLEVPVAPRTGRFRPILMSSS